MTEIDTLRSRARAARAALDPAHRAAASALICKRIAATRAWRASRRAALYWPVGSEVDVSALLDAALDSGKHVYLPVVTASGRMRFARYRPDGALRRNRYGILEPDAPRRSLLPPQRLDVVVAPLVAFDASGARIGAGGGYYDRAFAFLHRRSRWHRPKLFGAAFEAQKLERLPARAWDVALLAVFTERSRYPESVTV